MSRRLPGVVSWAWIVAAMATAGVVFGVLLRHDAAAWLGLPSLGMRYGGSARYLAVLVGLSVAALWRRDGWGALATMSLTTGLMAMILAEGWRAGLTDGSLVAGLLPFSDASGYYQDAVAFLHGAKMSTFSGRRPIFASLLAAILWLTGNDLRTALAILAAWVGLACGLAAFEVRLTYGRIAAVTFLLLNFLFARTYVGKVLTENVGLPLGALGLAALLRAARTERPPSAISGIWMMTAALVARAGAFFVLPVLWVWTAIAFPRTPRARALVVAAAIASTMAGFAADRVTRGIVAAPTAVAFSNFSYTLYGVVTGNRGWTQVTRDHPYVTQLAEPELSREIYRRSFAAMRARPWRALVGVLKTWGDYFTPSSAGAFGFLASNQVIRVRQCCFALAIIGLAACVLRRRQAAYSLPLACIAGVLASVPFLPPVDANSMRAYAATIPVVSLIVGLGASAVWTMIGRLGPLRAADVAGARSDDHAVAPGVLLLLGGVAVAAAVVGPALIGLEAAGAPAAVFAAAPCPEGASAFYLDVVPGSVVNVVDDGAALRSGPRGLRQSDLRRNIVPLYPELKAEVSSLDAGTTIFTGPTLGTYRRGVWLFAKTADMPATRTTMRACARMVDNAWLRQYGFFRADSLQPVAPAPRAPQ